MSIPRQMNSGMAAVSFLGQPFVTLAILGAIGAWGAQASNSSLVMASIIGIIGILVNSVLKLSFSRERPRTDYANNMLIDTFSFPSGHSAGSLIAYGLLTYLAWLFLPFGFALTLSIVSILLTLLIGISRAYLGAHYPSDVLGGWLIGTVTLLAIYFTLRLPI